MGNREPIARDYLLEELKELLGAYSMRKRSSMARSSPIHFATLNWRPVPASTLSVSIQNQVITAREVRMATYRRCERCGQLRRPNGCTIKKRVNRVPSSIWASFIEGPHRRWSRCEFR
jgi:hypothetical protein